MEHDQAAPATTGTTVWTRGRYCPAHACSCLMPGRACLLLGRACPIIHRACPHARSCLPSSSFTQMHITTIKEYSTHHDSSTYQSSPERPGIDDRLTIARLFFAPRLAHASSIHELSVRDSAGARRHTVAVEQESLCSASVVIYRTDYSQITLDDHTHIEGVYQVCNPGVVACKIL